MQNINYIHTSIYVKHDFVFIIYSGIENCSLCQKLANEVQIPFRYAFILKYFRKYFTCMKFVEYFQSVGAAFDHVSYQYFTEFAPQHVFHGRRSWHPRPQDAMVFINDIFQLINGYALSYILCLMCFYLILLY